MNIKIEERARAIEALVLDCDGVITDGTEIIAADGTVFKNRSYCDGQGISFLRVIGIRCAIISGEIMRGSCFLYQLEAKWNSLPIADKNPLTIFSGYRGTRKSMVMHSWANSLGISIDKVAAMGDDFGDRDMLLSAGFRAAPSSAEQPIKDIADFVSERPGGRGAIRDLVNFILKCKGIDPESLDLC